VINSVEGRTEIKRDEKSAVTFIGIPSDNVEKISFSRVLNCSGKLTEME